MGLHAPTVMVLTFALGTALGGILLFVWRQERRHAALAYWGFGHLVAGLALPLLALRGLIPDFASIDLANAVLAVAYAILWAGARRFEGRRTPLPFFLAGAAIWLLACRIPAFYADIGARVVLMSLVASGYSLLGALEFRRGMRQDPLPSHKLVITALLANATAYALRIPLVLLVPEGAPGSGLPGTLPTLLLTVIGIAMTASTALLLVALVREREARLAHAEILAARDAAASASTEKSRFLAWMSHELRTPLNGVLGMAQALAQDPLMEGERKERAVTLERAGRHLRSLVNDVLDLSRIEAGRMEFSHRPVALEPLLRETLDLVRGAASAKGVWLRLHVEPELPEALRCDPLRVRQILLNLLGNAVKFTETGGMVALSAAVMPGTARTAPRLRLMVTDNGPGVPAAMRPRLFQAYSQDSAEALAGRGAGLGLAISSGLARAMGGTLLHRPGPEDLGSIFEALLPLVPAAPPAAAPSPAHPDAPPMHVLVVDDVAVNRLVVRALLEGAGHTVSEAADGLAALDALRGAGLPGLVLMDVQMPGIDGLEATRRIRRLPGPAAGLPVIALTAEALPEQVARCLDAGMNGHVAKPVERETLLAALAEAATHRVA